MGLKLLQLTDVCCRSSHHRGSHQGQRVSAQLGSTASEPGGFQFDDRKHKVEVITSYSHKDCDLLDDRTQQAGDKSKVKILQSENDILIYSLGGLRDFHQT